MTRDEECKQATHTQILDQFKHDPTDVEVALNPEDSFHLKVGDVNLQVPRAITDNVPIGVHDARWFNREVECVGGFSQGKTE